MTTYGMTSYGLLFSTALDSPVKVICGMYPVPVSSIGGIPLSSSQLFRWVMDVNSRSMDKAINTASCCKLSRSNSFVVVLSDAKLVKLVTYLLPSSVSLQSTTHISMAGASSGICKLSLGPEFILKGSFFYQLGISLENYVESFYCGIFIFIL